MKPLTIEQLKSLEVGEWVWIVENKEEFTIFDDHSFYSRIIKPYLEEALCYGWNGSSGFLRYSGYGTKWVAYKNKEQAEGEIVELPCKVGDTKQAVREALEKVKVFAIDLSRDVGIERSVLCTQTLIEQIDELIAEVTGE